MRSRRRSSKRACVKRNPLKLPFEVRKSSIQGSGAFATRAIRKGQRIVEYTGERITDEVAYERYDDTSMKRHHTFLFAVDDDLSIDGAVGGNDSRFINHSCEPNCEAWIEDGDRVIIYARRDIAPNVELTYDYSYVGVDANDPEARAMYVCLCGSPKCRGSIVQPPPKKKKKKARAAATKAATRPSPQKAGSKKTSATRANSPAKSAKSPTRKGVAAKPRKESSRKEASRRPQTAGKSRTRKAAPRRMAS